MAKGIKETIQKDWWNFYKSAALLCITVMVGACLYTLQNLKESIILFSERQSHLAKDYRLYEERNDKIVDAIGVGMEKNKLDIVKQCQQLSDHERRIIHIEEELF